MRQGYRQPPAGAQKDVEQAKLQQLLNKCACWNKIFDLKENIWGLKANSITENADVYRYALDNEIGDFNVECINSCVLSGLNPGYNIRPNNVTLLLGYQHGRARKNPLLLLSIVYCNPKLSNTLD